MILFNVLINYFNSSCSTSRQYTLRDPNAVWIRTRNHTSSINKCNPDVILQTNPFQMVHVTGDLYVCVFAGAPDRYKWTGRNGCSVLFGSAQAKTLHVPLRAPQPQHPSVGHGERPDRHPQHPQHHQVNAHAPVQWPYPAQDVLLFCCRMNMHNNCRIEFQYNIKQLGTRNVQNNNSRDVHDVRSF